MKQSPEIFPLIPNNSKFIISRFHQDLLRISLFVDCKKLNPKQILAKPAQLVTKLNNIVPIATAVHFYSFILYLFYTVSVFYHICSLSGIFSFTLNIKFLDFQNSYLFIGILNICLNVLFFNWLYITRYYHRGKSGFS